MFRRNFIPLLLAFSLIGQIPSSAFAQEVNPAIYVQVNSTRVRGEPRHWATPKTEVRYGDPLQRVPAQAGDPDGWVRVKTAAGIEGFVHQSAITQRIIVLKLGQAGSNVNPQASEVVLAGKGFSQEIEDVTAALNADLNYTEVNRLEMITISAPDIESFLREGKLTMDSY